MDDSLNVTRYHTHLILLPIYYFPGHYCPHISQTVENKMSSLYNCLISFVSLMNVLSLNTV